MPQYIYTAVNASGKEQKGKIVAASAEEAILGILLLHPELYPSLQKGERPLQSNDFFTAKYRPVIGT